jgi:acyl-CoA thioester hydrolase
MVRRVEWRDLDQVHHVNNAVYLAYIEDCGLQVSAAHGWPPRRTREEGFAIIARRHRIEYRQPALYDDELEVATWASDIKRSSALRHTVLTRASDGAPVARARTLWVWVDLETGRPIRIPGRFLDDFAPNIVGGAKPGDSTQSRSSL